MRPLYLAAGLVFLGASPPCMSDDPLVLDMAGDGIDLGGQATTSLLGGPPRKVRWTRPNSDDAFVLADASSLASVGFVVRDAAGTKMSGLVLLRDGVHLQTPAGERTSIDDAWQFVRAFDANKDGKLDANDPAFTHLRAWQDRNGDGAIQTTELGAFGERGVRSVGTQSGAPRTDAHGNVLRDGTYQASSGAIRQATGVALATIEAPPPAPTPIPSPTIKPPPMPTPKPAPLPAPSAKTPTK
jgi:hypothetical protein